MYKSVAAVLATARIHLRRPSERKLATEDMHAVLHQILEEKHSEAMLINKDFYTHSLDLTISFDTTRHGYIVEVLTQNNQTVTEFGIIKLLYQNVSADPDEDDWYLARQVKLVQFPMESQSPDVVFCQMANAWQRVQTFDPNRPVLKMNRQPDFVETQNRWRVYARIFPNHVLQYDQIVPFPQEHVALLEYTLAERCLALVRDDSPQWEMFYQKQAPKLLQQAAIAHLKFTDWLSKDVENIAIDSRPYHYVKNNVLMKPRLRPVVEDNG